MSRDENPPSGGEDQGVHEAARRAKLARIEALGHDPWGGRFDHRMLIGDIRARLAEIQFVKEAGGIEKVPSREELAGKEFRQWLADQGKGEMSGPKVRAAGRIVLSRDAGKLRFVDIQDWTGRVQLFIGKAQEKASVWRTEKRYHQPSGQSYPWLVRATAMVNHYYIYALDREGP